MPLEALWRGWPGTGYTQPVARPTPKWAATQPTCNLIVGCGATLNPCTVHVLYNTCQLAYAQIASTLQCIDNEWGSELSIAMHAKFSLEMLLLSCCPHRIESSIQTEKIEKTVISIARLHMELIKKCLTIFLCACSSCHASLISRPFHCMEKAPGTYRLCMHLLLSRILVHSIPIKYSVYFNFNILEIVCFTISVSHNTHGVAQA